MELFIEQRYSGFTLFCMACIAICHVFCESPDFAGLIILIGVSLTWCTVLVYGFQVSYHVAFFDKQVSRAWVNAACIHTFSCEDDPEDMGKVCWHVD